MSLLFKLKSINKNESQGSGGFIYKNYEFVHI